MQHVLNRLEWICTKILTRRRFNSLLRQMYGYVQRLIWYAGSCSCIGTSATSGHDDPDMVGQTGGSCGVALCRKARLSMGRCPHLDSRWIFICAAGVFWMSWNPFAVIVVRVKTCSFHVCCIVHMTRPSVFCIASKWGTDWFNQYLTLMLCKKRWLNQYLTLMTPEDARPGQGYKCNNLAVCLQEVTSFVDCCTITCHSRTHSPMHLHSKHWICCLALSVFTALLHLYC